MMSLFSACPQVASCPRTSPQGQTIRGPAWEMTGSKGQKIDQYNVKAFVPNTIGEFGNPGRNALTGPGLANTDLGIFKKFEMGEKQHIEFRAEGFNAFNRTNLGTPVTQLSSPAFGKVLSAGNARIIKLGLKYVF
jgi:hypothetical protein